MDIRIGASVEVDDLIELITNQLDNEELFNFVKKLDLTVADWDFTDKLIDYFEAEKQKKASEDKEA